MAGPAWPVNCPNRGIIVNLKVNACANCGAVLNISPRTMSLHTITLPISLARSRRTDMNLVDRANSFQRPLGVTYCSCIGMVVIGNRNRRNYHGIGLVGHSPRPRRFHRGNGLFRLYALFMGIFRAHLPSRIDLWVCHVVPLSVLIASLFLSLVFIWTPLFFSVVLLAFYS